MNTTVEDIKEYVLKEYGIDFKLNYIGTHRYLEYVDKKKKYELSCDYARQPEIDDSDAEYWSIYFDYMDRSKWHGYGAAYLDEGMKTVDKIMHEWGFKKEKQLTIDDYIGG